MLFRSDESSTEDLLSARKEELDLAFEANETAQISFETASVEDEITSEMRNEQLKSMVRDMEKEIMQSKPERNLNVTHFPYGAEASSDPNPILKEKPIPGRGRLLRIINGYSPFKDEKVSQFTPIAENIKDSVAADAMRDYSKTMNLIFPTILGQK